MIYRLLCVCSPVPKSLATISKTQDLCPAGPKEKGLASFPESLWQQDLFLIQSLFTPLNPFFEYRVPPSGQVKREPSFWRMLDELKQFHHAHFLPLVNTPTGRLYYLQNSVENKNAGRVPAKNQGVNFPFPYPEQKSEPSRSHNLHTRYTRGWIMGSSPVVC